ncbi:MAG: UDP-N-acetylmuramoyl-L-alanine--D-glutamate ligase [Ignavibacteriales bacterium]|nr:UDP-N-acetylmuramoyl-L-alanine--D-glutamate ligase [Ignavibacteriales bacterium]
MQKNIVKGEKVSILGMARSGIAVAELLRSNGAIPFVSDNGDSTKLADAIISLKNNKIEYETGGHTDKVYDSRMLVLSPGVPSTSPIVIEASKRGLKIFSELEVSSWFCRAPIVAVTGTNGKTTTTSLIGNIFSDAGRNVSVGGNIGKAFACFAGELQNDAVAILEVSSFQLDYIDTFHPHISILLNITPDHLDRYENNLQKYIDSKCRIFKNQNKNDYLIYNHDDINTRKAVDKLASNNVRRMPFGIEKEFREGAFVKDNKVAIAIDGKEIEIFNADDIKIRGIHNLYNSMAAILAARLMNINPASIRSTLKTFPGVEHRLEFVRELDGVKYINDSKATNVDSVWYALQAYEEPIVVMIGGRDKGNDYTKLFEPLKKHVKAVIAIGESAGKVKDAFSGLKKVVIASSMQQAVDEARKLASSGDIVLLSPACASFDWFQNYEHRGQIFKEIVKALI